MQTREKYGTQARRLFKLIYEDRCRIWTFVDLFRRGREVGITDMRRLLDTVFMLEGLGFLTRISKNKFIFSGFRGTATRIIEALLNRVRKQPLYLRENWLFSEDIIVEGRKYSLRQSVYLGSFYQEILMSVFKQPSKGLTRETMEQIQEQTPLMKDTSLQLILNEMISIMTTFNLLQRNSTDNRSDSLEVYQWNGPDIYNNKGLTFESLTYSLKLKDSLYQRVNLNAEKEKMYFTQIFRDLPVDIVVHAQSQFRTIDVSYVPKAPISHFPRLSFAMLKGKNWTYLIQKLLVIVGRQRKHDQIKRDVDVELDASAGISRQHAVIQFNFQDECFEIRCISKKKTITVDSFVLSDQDNPRPLNNKTLIILGKENFMFFLPKQFAKSYPMEEQKQIFQQKIEQE